MDHASRVERLTADRTHPLLVTSLVNIRYLTGFTGSNAFFFAAQDGCTFVTDGRYGEMAEALVAALPDTDLVVYTSDLHPTLASVLGTVPRVDIESAHVSWALARTLDDVFDAELEPTYDIVEMFREIKDDDEIEALRRAADAGDAAFAALDELRADAATEGDLGRGLVETMRTVGGDQAGWPPIVAVGANASRPHHLSGDGPLGEGLLLMDYGCVVDGYHSDMTRTVWVGDAEPDEAMTAVHASVLASNEAGIATVRPGATLGAVDEACRAVLRDDGYEEYFVHSTGHGVGLEIHEPPWARRGNDDVLEPGHVITVEPGVYLPGRGGVRIEDMVLVTEDGHEVLTHSRKELLPT